MNKLHRKFTMLYTITTGFILSAIITMMLIWGQNQRHASYKEKFIGLMDQVQYIFQSTNMFSSVQFMRIEKENNVILKFENDGITYSYQGWFTPKTDRNYLIQKVIDNSLKEEINPYVNPASVTIKKSSIFTIHGEYQEEFYGQLVVFPINGGWKCIIMIQQLMNYTKDRQKQCLLFLLIDVVGIIFVYCFSRWFVKKTLQPVEEAQIKQKEFIAAASHELRSPLAVIKTGVSAMLKSKEREQEFAKDVNDEINRMSRLIDEMLLLAASQVDSWTLKMERISLDNFLIESYDKFLLLLHSKEVNLSYFLPEKMIGEVMVDQERLYQVISVLLENAASYAGENRHLELSVTIHKSIYEIAIIDHGKGISEEEKKHIFDRFYRVDQARNEKGHYGLGLSIAYEMCKRMNGSLHIKDTKGGGATFVISLPIC